MGFSVDIQLKLHMYFCDNYGLNICNRLENSAQANSDSVGNIGQQSEEVKKQLDALLSLVRPIKYLYPYTVTV